MDRYDLVIVGGGVAGLCAALSAPEGSRIAVVDKGEEGAGSSPLAQGGLAAAVGPGDSPELHAADTVAAGAGLCDPAVVADICGEGPDAIGWLLKMGCDFDRGSHGEIHVAREGAQSVARSVHWRDATGAEIVRALRAAARDKAFRIRARATSLAVDPDGVCAGVWSEDGPVLGRTTMLATGGAGALWAATTNAPGATGDGIALALMAGVPVADLEFMQFHPTALKTPGAQRVLLTEALRGDGAILVDANGERFVDELAARHVVAKAILDRGGAWLDCRHIEDLTSRFPTIVEGARRYGFDPLVDRLPVEPAAHYFIGGVASDALGRTRMPGLYAAGECSSNGMHGANRMAGNSLLEAVVVGRRIGASLDDHEAGAGAGKPKPASAVLTQPPANLAEVMWRSCGPIRGGGLLREGLVTLEEAPDEAPHTMLARTIVEAALRRAESRGVHVRSDHPQSDSALAHRFIDTRTPL